MNQVKKHLRRALFLGVLGVAILGYGFNQMPQSLFQMNQQQNIQHQDQLMNQLHNQMQQMMPSGDNGNMPMPSEDQVRQMQDGMNQMMNQMHMQDMNSGF